MDYECAMYLITKTNGSKSARRLGWKSPKQFVRYFDRYTKFTPYRSGLCCSSWYPKQEDIIATDWYIK